LKKQLKLALYVYMYSNVFCGENQVGGSDDVLNVCYHGNRTEKFKLNLYTQSASESDSKVALMSQTNGKPEVNRTDGQSQLVLYAISVAFCVSKNPVSSSLLRSALDSVLDIPKKNKNKKIRGSSVIHLLYTRYIPNGET
jgi:hypothetical protein